MKRRDFIGTTLLGSSGLVLGTCLLPSSCKGANDRIVMALVGAGSRGRQAAIAACQGNENVRIKTVCDVNDLKAAMTQEQIEKDLGYPADHVRDVRTVLDDPEINAVWVATPEHWHALATVWACQAGKDVYVEKNPTINIWEGRKMVEAASKYKRIVQAGFQNRSAPYAISAREYIQGGRLGQVVHVKCYTLLGGKKWVPVEDSEVPGGLDWDAWLGPAAYRPYNAGIHDMESRGGWENFWDFSGGELADDGSHVLDLARMVLGDPGHPESVYCWGGNHVWGSERETPEYQTVTWDFGKFEMTMECGNVTNYMEKTDPSIRHSNETFPEWHTNATRIEIYGKDGVMFLGRHGGGWQVHGPDGEIVAEVAGLFPDSFHQQNFIDCIRSRKQPNGQVEQAHLSASLVHLGNIAYRTGNRHLRFDGSEERFTGHDDANPLLKSSYREPYQIPESV